MESTFGSKPQVNGHLYHLGQDEQCYREQEKRRRSINGQLTGRQLSQKTLAFNRYVQELWQLIRMMVEYAKPPAALAPLEY